MPCWERRQILLDKCTQIVTGDADSSLSPNTTLFNFYELKCEVVTRVTVSRQRVLSNIWIDSPEHFSIQDTLLSINFIEYLIPYLQRPLSAESRQLSLHTRHVGLVKICYPATLKKLSRLVRSRIELQTVFQLTWCSSKAFLRTQVWNCLCDRNDRRERYPSDMQQSPGIGQGHQPSGGQEFHQEYGFGRNQLAETIRSHKVKGSYTMTIHGRGTEPFLIWSPFRSPNKKERDRRDGMPPRVVAINLSIYAYVKVLKKHKVLLR